MSTPVKSARVPQASAVGYVTSPMIRIVLGDADSECKDFFIHEGLISPRSGFFKKALEGPWKEAEARSVALTDEEPAIFAVYMELLYTSNLPVIGNGENNDHNNEYIVLSKLYVLAEFLHDDITKDVVLDAISAKSREVSQDGKQHFPDFVSIDIVYSGTLQDSPVRSLLVQLYTDNDLERPDGTSDNVPKDFVFDLAISLLANRPLRKTYEDCKAELEQNASEAERSMQQLQAEIRTLKFEQHVLRGERDVAIEKATGGEEELEECKEFVQKRYGTTWRKGMKASRY